MTDDTTDLEKQIDACAKETAERQAAYDKAIDAVRVEEAKIDDTPSAKNRSALSAARETLDVADLRLKQAQRREGDSRAQLASIKRRGAEAEYEAAERASTTEGLAEAMALEVEKLCAIYDELRTIDESIKAKVEAATWSAIKAMEVAPAAGIDVSRRPASRCGALPYRDLGDARAIVRQALDQRRPRKYEACDVFHWLNANA